MTMIDNLAGDWDSMVLNTKRGDDCEGEEGEGCIPVPLYEAGSVWPSKSACQLGMEWSAQITLPNVCLRRGRKILAQTKKRFENLDALVN